MTVPGPHRLEYTAALGKVRSVLADLAAVARQILVDATAAVAGPDHHDTAEIHAASRRLGERSSELDDQLVVLLARQAPVAGDLRLTLAALRIGAAIERMGELADHIAAAADLRAPALVVPAPLRSTVVHLGVLCADVTDRLVAALSSDDPAAAQRVEDADEPVDVIHRRMLTLLTDPDWRFGIEAAVDLALLSRYYERFADQAVTAARQLSRISGGVGADPDRDGTAFA